MFGCFFKDASTKSIQKRKSLYPWAVWFLGFMRIWNIASHVIRHFKRWTSYRMDCHLYIETYTFANIIWIYSSFLNLKWVGLVLKLIIYYLTTWKHYVYLFVISKFHLIFEQVEVNSNAIEIPFAESVYKWFGERRVLLQ